MMKRSSVFALSVICALSLASCASGQKKQDSATTATKDSKAAAPAASSKAAPAKKSAAPAAGASSATQVSCKGDTEERTIQIVAKGEGCDVVYTKAGQQQTVASAAHDQKYCEGVMTRMRDKLSGAGFTCN